MCAVQAGAFKASQSQLPFTTPVTAGLEQLGGGRSIGENLKQNTGVGKVKTFLDGPKPPAAAKRSKRSNRAKANSQQSSRTGSGLRINNSQLGSSLQIK